MGPAGSVSCSLHINGQLDNADSAVAFDGHDANCLRVLIVARSGPPGLDEGGRGTSCRQGGDYCTANHDTDHAAGG
jgi:hypothetical protein